MTEKLTKLTRKWWFYAIIIGFNLLIPPIATKGFEINKWADITTTTLTNSLYSVKWKTYYIPFQIFFIAFVTLLLFAKQAIGKWFNLFVSVCFILFAIGQNIAYTDKYGFSAVTINLIMFSLVSFSWIVDFIDQRTKYTFDNFKLRYLWMIIFSVLVFWLPFDFKVWAFKWDLKYFVTSSSSLTFCLSVPLFLTLLTLNSPNINLFTYRTTAFIGIILGLYNMVNFATPYTFWIGMLHIPLLTISIYCFRKSFIIEKQKLSLIKDQ